VGWVGSVFFRTVVFFGSTTKKEIKKTRKKKIKKKYREKRELRVSAGDGGGERGFV